MSKKAKTAKTPKQMSGKPFTYAQAMKKLGNAPSGTSSRKKTAKKKR